LMVPSSEPVKARRAKARGRRGGRKPQESNPSHGDGSLIETLHTSEDHAPGDTFTGAKVEGGRSCRREAARVEPRSLRSSTRRRGRRDREVVTASPGGEGSLLSSSRTLARGGRNGPSGQRGHEARSEQGSGGAKAQESIGREHRSSVTRYGFAEGRRLRSRRSPVRSAPTRRA
jgi:hypothetical protein